jgi:hypothetical protein
MAGISNLLGGRRLERRHVTMRQALLGVIDITGIGDRLGSESVIDLGWNQ